MLREGAGTARRRRHDPPDTPQPRTGLDPSPITGPDPGAVAGPDPSPITGPDRPRARAPYVGGFGPAPGQPPSLAVSASTSAVGASQVKPRQT
ncbi:hypothetical protein BJY27_003885 [Streptomyces rapamycinicus]|uniref:DNA-binding protein n=2 Tax=Streptomyces rapamycinicus TaxID=1226757 RepID=A0A3L8RP19_STRRN|nr:hypothetical protein [Streptomyces rapamycinicus]RLV81596.1 DNA-binding protein [Streptomyces rapamycinicus NRRL 5491]